MIEREYGQQYLVCDSCDDGITKTYDSDDFHRMIDDVKDAGWSVRSGNGGWVHTCPKCCVDFEDGDL